MTRYGMRIRAAAVRLGDKIWTLDPPHRHHHIMQMITRETGKRVPFDPDNQGFITECGRFLNRRQTETVARDSGQLVGDRIGSVLTSEDLW
jgi:hypothetical protein